MVLEGKETPKHPVQAEAEANLLAPEGFLDVASLACFLLGCCQNFCPEGHFGCELSSNC